jgi:hypothetical protein
MALRARAHRHGYLVLVTHRSILHPGMFLPEFAAIGPCISTLEKGSRELVRNLNVNGD